MGYNGPPPKPLRPRKIQCDYCDGTKIENKRCTNCGAPLHVQFPSPPPPPPKVKQ